MFCRRGISIMQKYGRLVVGVGMFMIDEWCHVIDCSFFAVSSRTYSIRVGPIYTEWSKKEPTQFL